MSTPVNKPPTKPTPPPVRTIKEGTREPGEPSLWQRLTGKQGDAP